MLEHIYFVLGGMCIIIAISLIAHYVFLEPKWEKWQYFMNMAYLIVLILGEILIQSEERVLLCLVCAGIQLGIVRKKHHIRGFFLILPIMGMISGILVTISDLMELLFGVSDNATTVVMDMATLVLLILFAWKGKNWREKFELEMQYRRLKRWESRLLICVGLMAFGIVTFSSEGTVVTKMNPDMRSYMVLSNLITLILTVTVIVLVMQGNKRAYYENIAELNARYLNAELQHFQAYQKTQIETRRVRHDMKNHMQSMLYFVKEEKFEDLKHYLESINQSVEQIDAELHCGNALADAICNEKNQMAVQKGISFEIEGSIPENTRIELVDICTIFANALDNAIEALEDESILQRWIKLEISHQGEILFLRFTNPIGSQQNRKVYGNTSKKDKIHHGFGLQNIQMAVEKYHGKMYPQICEEKNGSIFSLELMLSSS